MQYVSVCCSSSSTTIFVCGSWFLFVKKWEFKASLDVSLGSLVSWSVNLPMTGELKLDDLWGPFQPTPFYDSMIFTLESLTLCSSISDYSRNYNPGFVMLSWTPLMFLCLFFSSVHEAFESSLAGALQMGDCFWKLFPSWKKQVSVRNMHVISVIACRSTWLL